MAVRAASGVITVVSNHVHRNAVLVEFQRLKKAPRPTVIAMAGSGGLSRVRRTLGFDEAARASGMDVVYPEALDGHWRLGTDKGRVDDVDFIKRLAMKLSSEAISDRRRIYLVGIGSGGVLALRLACDDPELFAGVAVVGAALPRDAQASCKINRPIAFMMINGTADPKVPFAGGQASLTDFKQPVLSSDDTIAPFAAAAGCAPGQKTQTQTPHRDPKAPTRATLIRYTSCKAPVEFYRIEGGGHTIPTRASIRRRGADANNALGPQNHDISAGRVIASFFQRRAG